MSLPKLLQDIAEKYLDGRKDAFWQHKQSGQWLIKHRDLEIAAGRAGIRFDAPVILEAKAGESVAMVVTGRLTQWAEPAAEGLARARLDDAVEWSIGEASPKNTTQAYPYAMAEKRAKDRVILKLFGIHGHAYSEEEFKEENKVPPAEKTAGDKESAAIDWALGYVEAREGYSDTVGLDGENSAKIAAACKYPAARKVLADAGVPL